MFSLLTPFIIGFQTMEDLDRLVTVWSSNEARGQDMSVVSLDGAPATIVGVLGVCVGLALLLAAACSLFVSTAFQQR
ncbi:MAG: hypothetical protein IH939_20155 [Acidobacteria bacterium]|nr:hypothetical protein [Acidobacteriota bacterium]